MNGMRKVAAEQSAATARDLMSEFDTVISGVVVVTASDTFKCDNAVREGRIAALGEKLQGRAVIDASGKLVLPGGIDSHGDISQPSGPETIT